MKDLVAQALAGETLSIARLISRVEREAKGFREGMREVHGKVRGVPIVGVTGVAGSGKSTLIAGVAKRFRSEGKRVGIIAIDPTSPFSGGAVLGDRVRMTELLTDAGVFIRSMGTRGMSGGLASAVYDVAWILDACGFDRIIVETVGIGQDEVDVARIAETTLVVLVPNLGDAVQMIKAGIMEIGDILVVNKADLPGAEQTAAELEAMLELGGRPAGWKPPILKTAAQRGEGIDALFAEIERHRAHLEGTVGREELERRRYEGALAEFVKGRLMRSLSEELDVKGRTRPFVERLMKGETDPHAAAEEILEGIIFTPPFVRRGKGR